MDSVSSGAAAFSGQSAGASGGRYRENAPDLSQQILLTEGFLQEADIGGQLSIEADARLGVTGDQEVPGFGVEGRELPHQIGTRESWHGHVGD